MRSFDERFPHVVVSGGLLSQDALMRLIDESGKYPEMAPSSYPGPNDETGADTQIAEFWEWAKEKWDEVSQSLSSWNLTQHRSNWMLPFLRHLGYDTRYQRKNESVGTKDAKISIHVSHRGWTSRDATRIHLIHSSDGFDKVAESDRNKNSPHESLQKLLVLNDNVRWGIIFNGKSIRLLREYYHIYTRGYVEFDLENILSDRREDEFHLLYRIVHASRFKTDGEDIPPIDKFFEDSTKSGVKIGDELRNNVHRAIELLGNSLLDDTIREELQKSPEAVEDYYAQILRVVYRVVFIVYAEQRGMLPEADTLYGRAYSLTHLREKAEETIISDRNVDLWRGIQKTFEIVGKGIPGLGVPGYDGELFDLSRTETINNLDCRNEDILQVIRYLTTTTVGGIRQRISFLDLDVEEMGAVYESLLDYRPRVLLNSREIEGQYYRKGDFALLPQSAERKSTGSYYTSRSLVDILVKTALAPVLEKRLENAREGAGRGGAAQRSAQIDALLQMNICDPACGSGAFLLAAMDFLGLRLAGLETGSLNPSDSDIRLARRRVLQRCIYGVDKNPLAIELTKMSLWLHAFVKDIPLNFLDHHIKVGDSLVGATDELVQEGILPEAFEALRGQKSTGINPESRSARNAIRKKIRKETDGLNQSVLSEFAPVESAESAASALHRLETLPESSVEEVFQKAQEYSRIETESRSKGERVAYDAWTAAFFWPMNEHAKRFFPTTGTLREAMTGQVEESLASRIDVIASELGFFHWHLEFPDVFESEKGGFDCILTNPPWETLQMKENEFFSGLAPPVEEASTQARRRKEISKLAEANPELHERYVGAWRNLKRVDHFYRDSGLYPLSAKGTINTYALFVERTWRLLGGEGLLGTIVPSGIATSYYMQDFFREMVTTDSLISLFDFENRKALFDIHRMFRFCLLVLSGGGTKRETIPMAFYIHDPDEVQEDLLTSSLLSAEETISETFSSRIIRLGSNDFNLMNPNSLTAPVFRNRTDYEITRRIYSRAPVLIRRNVETSEILQNDWRASFIRVFDMATDSSLFVPLSNSPFVNSDLSYPITIGGKQYVPLYEGKMVWFYDHRYNSVEETSGQQGTGRATTDEEHSDPGYIPSPRYLVEETEFEERVPSWYNRKWFVAFRRVARSVDKRTLICAIVPRYASSDGLPYLLTRAQPRRVCALVANMSSITLDYIARQKTAGTQMGFYILEQLPLLGPDFYEEGLLDEIARRVVGLSYTSHDLVHFANDCGFLRQPYPWNQGRRDELVAELDGIFAHLYGFGREDYEYVLSTFSILFPKPEDYQLHMSKYQEMKHIVEENR